MFKNLLISVFLLMPLITTAQDGNKKRVAARLENGDTTAQVFLHPVVVAENWSARKKRRYNKKFLKLIRDVKKAYPYAKLAGNKLKTYQHELDTMKNDRQRRKFLDKVEDELRAEYEGDLKSLTISQGIILIKLVDRETGDTSYELVKQFRGSFSAFFWQSVARLFGHNLKLRYDPMGEDYLIEHVVQLIESGKV